VNTHQHIRQAERLLDDGGLDPYGSERDSQYLLLRTAQAQAHAILALAIATGGLPEEGSTS
jgi:hypothetical protein